MTQEEKATPIQYSTRTSVMMTKITTTTAITISITIMITTTTTIDSLG